MKLGQTGRKRNIQSLFCFEIFFKIACLSFAFPGFHALFEFCLWASGYSYITKENLKQFLLSPCVLLGILLVTVLFSFGTIFEANAVCLVVQWDKAGRKITLSELFYGAIKETRKLLQTGKKGLKIAIGCVLFVLLVNVPELLFMTLGFSWTENGTKELAWIIGFVLFGIGAIGVAGLIFSSKRSLLHGMLKRGICLFVTEALLYVAGWWILAIVIVKGATIEVSGVFLMRVFERYHLVSGILFLSLNTVVFEYFLATCCFANFKEKNRRRSQEEKSRRRKRKDICFYIGCTAICLFAVAQMFSFLRNKSVIVAEALEEVCITAHRGASSGAPENTMSAIALAVKEGADYAEIDVRLTADGVPVLLHDKALFRTTRVLKDIDEVTYAELLFFDAGSSYSKQYVGERVPRLSDVLSSFGGEIGFNIELKEKKNKKLVNEVVLLVEQYGLEESCVITSSSMEMLQWVKEQNRSIKTGYILSLVYGDFYNTEEVDFFSVKSTYVTEEVVEKVHAKGKEIHAWTVNREKELKRMKAIGADNIITNKPAYAREIIQRNQLAGTLEEWFSLLAIKN